MSHKLVRHSQVNSSSSKQQFEFGKQQRFPNLRKQFQPPFYELPSSIDSKRSTSLGYGKRSSPGQINAKEKIPGPGAYALPPLKDRSYSIGMGRQQVKANSVFGSKNLTPGPGQYQKIVEGKPYKNLSFSIGMRLKDKSCQWQEKVPGPGSYKPICQINRQGSYILSFLKNSCCTRFGKSSRKGLVQNSLAPGPGMYEDNTKTNPQGVYPISKLKSHRGSSFTRSPRKGIAEKSLVPGPGSYPIFSQFASKK